MITLKNADAALKDYYLDAVTSQLNAEVSPFFNAIQKTSENVFGKDVKVAIAKGGMAGVVAGKEDGDLPEPRSNRYYSITLPLKNIYGTIEISDKALRASGDTSGGFVNLLNAEMEGLIASAKANFARMLYGDGNGVICRAAANQVTAYEIKVDNAKSCYAGLPVMLGTTPPFDTTIKSVDTENSILIIEDEPSPFMTAGEKIWVEGAEDNELLGLASIFDGTTLYGYNKEYNPYFAPRVKKVAIDSLTEDDLIDMIDSLEESADGKVDMILCSHKVRKKIASLMSASRRIVNSTDIAAGFSSIVINDVPVYADKFCPEDRIYFLNTADFSLNQLGDWAWLEDEGGKILRQVAGKAAYSATLVKYAELVCKKPCGQGAIILSES